MLAHVECAAPARPRLFVGESLAEFREEAPDRLEYLANLRSVAAGRWRTDVPLAFRYLRFGKGVPVSDVRIVPVGWPLAERGRFASPSPRHVRLREIGADGWRSVARRVARRVDTLARIWFNPPTNT